MPRDKESPTFGRQCFYFVRILHYFGVLKKFHKRLKKSGLAAETSPTTFQPYNPSGHTNTTNVRFNINQ